MKLYLTTFCSLLLSAGMIFNASADELVAQEYTIDAVTEIVAGGAGTIEISQGDSEYLRVEATADVMKRVKVDLTNHKLSLGVKDANGNFFHWFDRNNDPVKFVVKVKTINVFDISGAITASLGVLNAEKLWIKNSGATKIDVTELKVDNLSVESSGAANTNIQTLNAQQVRIDLSGASNFNVKKSGAVQQLNVVASGASNYRGKPLFVAGANAQASGASNIDIQVSEKLHAIASGASNINYYGSAKVTVDISGASHVNGHQ